MNDEERIASLVAYAKRLEGEIDRLHTIIGRLQTADYQQTKEAAGASGQQRLLTATERARLNLY